MNEYDDFLKKLDALGLPEVRSMLVQERFGNQRKKWAESWVERQDMNESKSDTREHLSVAKKALYVSFLSLVVAVVSAYFSFKK